MGKRDPKHGGGPQTAEGWQTALANLHGEPETAALTHQGRRWMNRALAPSCNHCADRERCEAYAEGGTCRLAEEQQAELIERIMALPQIRPEHEALVRAYVRDAVLVEILARYIGATSPLLPGADRGYLELQPALNDYGKAVSRMQKLAAELGLTPAARARLGLGQDGRPQGLAHIMEAEFEPVQDDQEGTPNATD